VNIKRKLKHAATLYTLCFGGGNVFDIIQHLSDDYWTIYAVVGVITDNNII